MFLVESISPTHEPGWPVNPDFEPAYYLVGDEKEVDAFRRYTAAAALGGASLGILQMNRAGHIVDVMAAQAGITKNYIPMRLVPTLSQILENEQRFTEERAMRIVEAGAAATLTTQEVLAELALLERQRYQGEQKWVTKDGLMAGMAGGVLTPNTYEIDTLDDVDGPHSNYMHVAAMLGERANAYAYQMEVVQPSASVAPQFLSDREHVVLGNTDHTGNFTPLVTVLDSEHPAIDPSHS